MHRKMPRFACRATAVSCLLGLWLSMGAAHAAPLNLVPVHPGDVTTHFTSVSYSLDANPATGTLTASGFPDMFDVNSQNILNSSFELSLTVLRATGAVVSGSVTITGDTDGVPSFGGLLLQGTITDFGFHDPPVNPNLGEGSIFEFLFDVTGGALAAPYYTDNRGGIILNFANGSGSPSFTGVFTAAFANDGFSGLSDTFPQAIPEPSSLALLGIGALALVGRIRRRTTAR